MFINILGFISEKSYTFIILIDASLKMADKDKHTIIIKIKNLTPYAGSKEIRAFFNKLSICQVLITGGIDGEAFVTFR